MVKMGELFANFKNSETYNWVARLFLYLLYSKRPMHFGPFLPTPQIVDFPPSSLILKTGRDASFFSSFYPFWALPRSEGVYCCSGE
jgi:hypothetical protein